MGIINLTKIHSSLHSPIRLHFPTQFAQSNFTFANQTELRNSSFQPGFNFDKEFPSMTTFQPKGTTQMPATSSAPLKHSHSTQFNLPSPHLCPSKSTNGTFDNLRKHRLSFNGHQ